jgi:hypothetical protein
MILGFSIQEIKAHLGLLIAKAFWDTFFIAVDKVQIGLFRAL